MTRHDTTRTRHDRHERQTQCNDNTDVTGRYLKQYAIQANPTNTDSTTASNNITMFMVLILFPSCSPAREGSRALVRRHRPLPNAYPSNASTTSNQISRDAG